MKAEKHLLVAVLALFAVRVSAERDSHARAVQGAVSRPNSPGLAGSEYAIVLSRVEEDVTFLELFLPHIQHYVYQNGDNSTAGYGTSLNTCGESMVYLTFIIDHYHALPEAIVFAHAHREAWHLKDKVDTVSRLQWGRHGFANLRHANMTCPQHWTCPMSWNRFLRAPSRWTGSWLHPRDYSNPAKVKEPVDKQHWSYKDEARDAQTLAEHWKEVFLGALGPLPALLHSPCCAEFVVTRAQIVQRPRDFYVHLREWASSGRLPDTTCGRVFEHTWAMIFGEAPVSEAKAECDLLFCDPSTTS